VLQALTVVAVEHDKTFELYEHFTHVETELAVVTYKKYPA